jgi:hypothetical protein
MPYPGSTTEFRILIKKDGSQVFQLRYVNPVTGYVSEWEDVQIVMEKQ